MSYNIGMYLRLSSDDGDIDGSKVESNSISGQRILIRSFINSHPDLKRATVNEYCDDGFSGINFNRPDVTRLLEDIKAGVINCVVVKDFSRFGRNFLEVGNFLEQIFPILNIRFISINDSYDSSREDNYTANIEAAFKNLINEAYSWDISAKVKATKELHKKQGFVLGGKPPFGYKTENKRLVIDHPAARIVRQIFHMADKGTPFIDIAKQLNRDGVPTRSNKSLWRAKDVSAILHNKTYIGTYVCNYRTSISPKVMKNNNQDDWLTFENHHKPIVDKETFERVQKRFNKFTHKQKPDREYYNELKGKVFCKGCGQPLHRHYINNRQQGKTFYYKCDYGREKDCCHSRFFVEKLKAVVIASVKAYMDTLALQVDILKEKDKATDNSPQRDVSAIIGRIDDLEKQVLLEYTNYINGVISRDEFSRRKEKLKDEIYVLTLEKQTLEKDTPDTTSEQQAIIDKFAEEKKVTDEMISCLVNRICIDDNEEVYIEWNFKDFLVDEV